MAEKCGVARRSNDVNVPGVEKIGKPCAKSAGWGTDHPGVGPCRLHGGNLPEVRDHGAELLREMAFRKQVLKFATRIDKDPETALMDMVREAAGNVAWLGARLEAMQEAESSDEDPRLVQRTSAWGTATTGYDKGSSLFGPVIDVDKEGVEHIVSEEYRGMLKLYNEERDRLVKYSKAALDAGIAKAQVELAQSQGQTIVVIVNRVLTQVGLDEARMLMARELIAQEFRNLAQAVPSRLGDTANAKQLTTGKP